VCEPQKARAPHDLTERARHPQEENGVGLHGLTHIHQIKDLGMDGFYEVLVVGESITACSLALRIDSRRSSLGLRVAAGSAESICVERAPQRENKLV